MYSLEVNRNHDAPIHKNNSSSTTKTSPSVPPGQILVADDEHNIISVNNIPIADYG